MKTIVGYESPTGYDEEMGWPDGALVPVTGDKVLFRVHGQSWVFDVLGRKVAVGTDEAGEQCIFVTLIADEDPPSPTR